MANEESHVDGTVERIENQIHVHILPQLAAEDPTAERGIGFLTPRLQETFAKSCDQVAVALSGAQHGGDDTPTAAKQYLYQLTHLLAHVGANGACIWKVQFAGGAAGKCIGDESGFIRPPAVDCCFANTGMGGHGFNRELGEPFFRQQA